MSRIANSLAESRIEATLRGARRLTYAVSRMKLSTSAAFTVSEEPERRLDAASDVRQIAEHDNGDVWPFKGIS